MLSGLCLAPTLARAETKPSEWANTSAEPIKKEGDLAMLELNYKKALELYEEAFQLSKNPTLLYNQARAVEGLLDYPAALKLLERFSKEAPPASKAQVPRLGDLMAELRLKISSLLLKVDLTGARVTVRGQVMGNSPLPALQLNAGPATIEVYANDYKPFKKEVVLSGGKELVVDVALEKQEPVAEPVVVAPPVSGDSEAKAKLPVECKAVASAAANTRGQKPEAEDASVRLASRDHKKPMHDAGTGQSNLFKKWWFWTGVGVVVAGGVVAAVALTSEKPATSGSLGQLRAPLLRF